MKQVSEHVNCPYCLSEIETGQEKIRCPKCGVLHHAECWRANGRCSVYGCDGWVIWNSQITDKVAPSVAERIEIEPEPASSPESEKQPRCIKCGVPVRTGQVTCWHCASRHRFAFFENCVGPTAAMLCITIGTIGLIVKVFF